MALAILLADVFKGAEVLWLWKFRWLAFLWIAMFLIAALLLISYRELPGAYKNKRSGPERSELLPLALKQTMGLS